LKGGGAGGSFLWSPADLLSKNVGYTSIIIKSTLRMKLFLKTSEIKKFVTIFCEACLIFLPLFSFRNP
jgi:hypothetical protein